MIHLFLNGLAASAGGGLTYLRNVLPHLAARTDTRTTVVLSPQLQLELQHLENISFVETGMPDGAARRFWHEQTVLPQLIRNSGADALISAGNFAIRKSPVPQVLLSRNSLYISEDFFRDLAARRHYRLWMDTRIKGILAKRSIRWADCTVAPSRTFAEALKHWSGTNVAAIYHGFDRDRLFRNQEGLPAELERQLESESGTLRLLLVSHYNYYRNFETLFRAVPLIREGLAGRKLKIFLTCTLRSEDNPGHYQAEGAAALIEQLGIAENVVELGAVPYSQLHQVYRACDIYVAPAYAESFSHPLVEAMASGLPVVASDLALHREICGAAAIYFPRFSPAELAARIIQVANSVELGRALAGFGRRRASDFSWSQHVEELTNLTRRLVEQSSPEGRRERV
jgi:glycosyltransferase involved in cell wall biosynthesis